MIRLEIRPGEGGQDAKLLLQDQADIYRAYAVRRKLSIREDKS